MYRSQKQMALRHWKGQVNRMYMCKTVDEYDIETDYGYGWEVECCESTYREAKQRVKEYSENARGLVDIRIRKRRVPIKKGSGDK